MNIVITSISSTTIHVSWDPVPEIHQNGIITGYDVTYNQSTFLQLFPPMTMRVSADGDSVTLTGLEEYMVYSIRVRAYTSIGAGPYSPLHNIRTPEDGKFLLCPNCINVCVFNIMSVYVPVLFLFCTQCLQGTQALLQLTHCHQMKLQYSGSQYH